MSPEDRANPDEAEC